MAQTMKVLDRWQAAAESVSLVAVRGGGALMFVSAFLVGFDVIARKALGWSLGGADELSGYAFAIATSWSLAFALLQRANVRIDALYSHLPRPLAAAIDLIALLALGFFVGLLLWFAAAVLQDSLRFETRANTPLAVPQWMPQSLWVAGFLVFVFAWLPLVLRCALALFRGDFAAVQAMAGARTLAEDANEEAAHVHTRADDVLKLEAEATR